MSKKKLYFTIELFIAVFIISIIILLVGKKFFFASNNLYLVTTDAVPHYTKIEYLAECIKHLKWPSWFPYWYNGATVMQYYPPLSFLMLLPLELIFHNSTIALKIFIFSSLFTGGLGVWYLYHNYIGRWFGILAAVLYVAQPYFKISLLGWGVIAQAPILAIAPWHLIASINYFRNSRIKNWLLVLFLTLLLLLSHVMHGFMIALSIVVVLSVAGFVCKKGIGVTIMWGIAAALAAALIGMWWVPGVLPLETPGIPYLLPESALNVTANLTWFIPWADNIIHAYFSGSLIIICILSLYFVYKEKSEIRLILGFLYGLTIFTFIFSFGLNLPFFKYFPLANSLVPGRIVTETAIGASLLTAYFIKKIVYELRYKKFSRKLIYVILAALLYDFTVVPNHKFLVEMSDYSWVEKVTSAVPNTGTNFEKGRLAWTTGVDSIYTYFPRKYDLNIISGWNIEGTPHNKYLWLQNTAVSNGSYDYIIKKMNDMNVRSYYLVGGQSVFYEKLKKEGFNDLGDYAIGKLLYNNKPSSYFYKQKRKAIVIGNAVSTFVMAFPWAVEGKSNNIADYKLKDFKEYDMIIFEEPAIDNIRQQNYFEELVKNLSKQNKTIFIEMGRQYFPSSILGVSFLHYKGSSDTKILKGHSIESEKDFYIPENEEVIGLTGLDESLYTLKQSTVTRPIDIIGSKYIDNNKVYFIGGPLNQLFSTSLAYLTGLKFEEDYYKKRDVLIRSALENIFSNKPHYTELGLPIFETKNAKWDYEGCSFEYDSETTENIMISVTYTPRWKIKVDGVKVETNRVDNMVCINLPSGKHNVEMHYGSTWVEILGWAASGLSVLLFILVLKFNKSIVEITNALFNKLLIYLDIKKNY